MPKVTVDVDAIDILRELSFNFTDPLELVREGISNAYDAGANNIWISVKSQTWHGNARYVVTVRDDGAGMVFDEAPPAQETGSIRKFFNLGGSMRIDGARDWIGEKGIGMKIAFHSEYIEIRTWAGGELPAYKAFAEEPWRKLHDNQLPDYDVAILESPSPEAPFTELTVVGFFDNDASHFSADELEDYIKWFTKWGSFEQRIRDYLTTKNGDAVSIHLSRLRPAPTGVLTLDAPGAVGPRVIPFGHPFPDSGSEKIDANLSLDKSLSALAGLTYEDLVEKANELKRKHWMYFVRAGQLSEYPDVTWEAIVSVEGDGAKRSYNPYLRTRGLTGRFSYKAEERYGLWFCKDFFCAAHANDVAMEVLTKEGQRSRFKVLFNSQSFRMNADRTNVGNTDAGILTALGTAAKDLVGEMTDHSDWVWTDLLEEETEVLTSEVQDERQLRERCEQSSKKPLIRLSTGDLLMRVPTNEAETVQLLERLSARHPGLFDFYRPLDWRTDKGIDSVVEVPGPAKEFRFVEFKKELRSGTFNHTFKHLHYVVCWEVATAVGSMLKDTAKKQMMLKRHLPDEYDLPLTAPWTLEGGQQVVKVFALKDILFEKLQATIEPPG